MRRSPSLPGRYLKNSNFSLCFTTVFCLLRRAPAAIYRGPLFGVESPRWWIITSNYHRSRSTIAIIVFPENKPCRARARIDGRGGRARVSPGNHFRACNADPRTFPPNPASGPISRWILRKRPAARNVVAAIMAGTRAARSLCPAITGFAFINKIGNCASGCNSRRWIVGRVTLRLVLCIILTPRHRPVIWGCAKTAWRNSDRCTVISALEQWLK